MVVIDICDYDSTLNHWEDWETAVQCCEKTGPLASNAGLQCSVLLSCMTSGTYWAYFLIVLTCIPPIPSANRILRVKYALDFLLRPTTSGRAVKGKRCTKQAEAAGVRAEMKESENVNKEWLRAASLESAMRQEFTWFMCAHIFQG